MFNTKTTNTATSALAESIVQWHHDRNLIAESSDWQQTPKLLEEFIEVVAAQMPESTPYIIAKQMHSMIDTLLANGRIKSVKPEDAKQALLDGLGDMVVVQLNLLERNGHSLSDAMTMAYHEIKDRKGRMIDGVFYKEKDLDADGNPIK